MRTIAAINLAIVTTILLVILGLGFPRSVDDGLAEISGPRRVVAEEALELARSGCSDNVSSVLTRGFRVESVRSIPPDPAAPVQDPPLVGYEVEIRRLTLFALPVETLTVREWGVECH